MTRCVVFATTTELLAKPADYQAKRAGTPQAKGPSWQIKATGAILY